MATVTGHRCRNVSHGFALFDAIVVALGTAARGHSVMCKESRPPTGGAVTTVTVHRGRQMVGGFERGNDTAARRVALEALSGRAPKQTL
jgi:hypothetical protein